MPLQGLMLFIFMFVIIPVLLLSTNHYIFFIVAALILAISSIRNIYEHIFNIANEEDDAKDENMEELDDMLELDVKKLGTGMNVIKSLFLILFYVYCAFNLVSFLFKIASALLILVQVHDLKSMLRKQNISVKVTQLLSYKLKSITGLLSLVLIIFTGYNLIIGYVF